MATLGHIDDGTVPTDRTRYRWGVDFSNKEQYLPTNGVYKEYRVEPPAGTTNGGTRRIVTNIQTGEIYYTWTHYGQAGDPPFVRIR